MTEDETRDDFHTGPEDCQKCGAQVPFPVAKFGKPGPNHTFLIACMCMDCLVAAHNLEWRVMKPSTIVVPTRQEGAVH